MNFHRVSLPLEPANFCQTLCAIGILLAAITFMVIYTCYWADWPFEDDSMFQRHDSNFGIKVREALRQSLPQIFNSTLIFTLILNCATLIYWKKATLQYGITFAGLLSAFSCLAMICLFSLLSRIDYCRIYRALGFAAAGLLTFVVVGISFVQLPPKTPWEKLCIKQGFGTDAGYWRFLMIVGLVLFGMTLLGLLVLLWIRHRDDYGGIKVRIGLLVIGICGLYFILIVIGLLRFFMNFDDGDLYMENNWGFGQLLAIATWVPGWGTFFFILCCKFAGFNLFNSRLMDDSRE
jgi:hypothetical protein